jgi:8-oxo-dGTP pyrophosphatase MutT (NUDIX family)
MRIIVPSQAKLVPKEAKRVFEGKIFDVYQWEQKEFDGSYKTYEMLKRPDTVVIIGVKDDKIVVIDEKQPGGREYYGFVMGKHDIDEETELEAAKREMREETGLIFKTYKLLDVVQAHNKIEWFIYIFLAKDFEKQIEPRPESGEKINVELIDFDEMKKLESNPKTRGFPKILQKISSPEELLELSEYR